MPFQSMIHRAGIVAAVLVIASCALIANSLWRDRTEAIAEAQRNNVTMSVIVSKQLERSVRMIDNLTYDIAAMLPAGSLTSLESLRRNLNSPGVQAFLESRLQRHMLASVITIIDREGKYVVTTRSWPTPGIDVSQGEFFAQMRDQADSSLAVSKTISNRVSGDWTLYFARRLVDADGNFLGYISVGMLPNFFDEIFDGVSQLPGVFIRLMRRDGYILAGNADSEQPIVGRVPPGNEWYAIVASGGGPFRAVGVYSNFARLIAARPIRNYPLAISVGIPENLVLSRWQARAIPAGLERAALAGLVAGLLYVLYLYYLKTRAAKEVLQARSSELSLANGRFDLVLTNMHQGVAMFDDRGRVLVRNQRFVEIYKLPPGQVALGTSIDEIAGLREQAGTDAPASESRAKVGSLFQSILFDHTNVEELRDGRRVLVSVQKMPDGGWISTHEDITMRHAAAEKIEHLASHDVLTGLANRAHFIATLKELMPDGEVPDPFAVLILDLDEFKGVNDTYGHAVGDMLLKDVAQRIVQAAGAGDTVARFGGDEFVVLHPFGEDGEESLNRLIDQLLVEFHKPCFIDGRELRVGLSIGVALSCEEVVSSEVMMRRADIALYKAKSDGRNCARFYQSEFEREIQFRRELALDLDAALRRGELEVAYQPIVDARTFDVCSMEALARWRHPRLGDISPAQFIPLAEEVGLIGQLGHFVLEAACRAAMHWPAHVRVSVNVSPLQIGRPDLVETVMSVLASSGLSANRLEFEITETVMMNDDEANIRTLRALHDLGIKIVLDDFGTGFSSLSYLDRFPFDKIKIDRSFVMRANKLGGPTAIIAAINSIAHAYDAITTAEGVETFDQSQFLKGAGVNQFQGYLFGAPLPARDWIFDGGKALVRGQNARLA